ncbi:glycosyl hydrolase family 28-related protein [Cohnella massiliensis]|uniref:glycosyl hydrolase family 28-related protein n=1 Tax=Cohnella massiliensis TaxID=1816691 RepID=UPI0009BAF62F|nr:right-handed parallel beta-helix repeat-containing protein [Cohnella massiliensis]
MEEMPEKTPAQLSNARINEENWSGVALNVKAYGAVGDGVTDDSDAILQALLDVPDTGGTVFFPAGVYIASKTLWMKSRTTVLGYGGRSRVAVIKRADGMYDDLFCAGVYTGVRDKTRSGSADWAGGQPYTKNNPGFGISFQGIYIDGNNANAGQNPKVPGNLNSYRGSNIWLQYVDGIHIEDIWSDYAPNDGAFVSGRHITISNSLFSNTKIINKTPGSAPTNNGITIAGTMAGIDGDVNDMITVTNVQAFNNDDLGVAIQARQMDNANAYHGGTVVCSNVVTKGNRTYGLAIEAGQAAQNVANTRPMKKVVLNNIISDNDAVGRLYSIGIRYDIEDLIVSNVIINNANNGGLVINGHNRIKVDNVHIRNYALNPEPEGLTTVRGMHIYCDEIFPSIDRISVKNVLITGGSGRTINTEGINVSAKVLNIELENVEVAGTTWISERGVGISIGAQNVVMTNCRASLCGDDGIKLNQTVKHFRLTNCEAFNNGQNPGAPSRRGINILSGDGTIPLRVGDLTHCWAYDDQAAPTQYEGIKIPGASDSDAFRIAFCRAFGNAHEDFAGYAAGSKHSVWGNLWGAQDADNAFKLEGKAGAWNQNLLSIGPYHLFIDNGGGAYAKFRIMHGKPKSPDDGFLLPHVSFGTAIPAFSPSYAGQKHIDRANGRVFEAVGESSASDFRQMAQTGHHKAIIPPVIFGPSGGTYTNNNAYPIDVVFTGGNVTDLEISRDAANFYSLGITSGPVRLSPGDRVRVTHTAAPMHMVIPR